MHGVGVELVCELVRELVCALVRELVRWIWVCWGRCGRGSWW